MPVSIIDGSSGAFYNYVEMGTTQVSAYISEETKKRLERFVRRTGQTRAHVIEQALLQHLQALEELPADVLVPARIVLDAKSATRVREALRRPSKPTKAMKRLFDDRRDPTAS